MAIGFMMCEKHGLVHHTAYFKCDECTAGNTVGTQLQAKIRAVVSRIDLAVEKCDGSYSRIDIANELRELSAVQ